MLKPDVWMTMQERQRAMLRVLRRLRTSAGRAARDRGRLRQRLEPAGAAAPRLRTREPRRHRAAARARARGAAAGAICEHAGDANALHSKPKVSTSSTSRRLLIASRPAIPGAARCADVELGAPRRRRPVVRLHLRQSVEPRREWRSGTQDPCAVPAGGLHQYRLTLAPPLARRICTLHPALYTICNALPLLRTHLMCWIVKP